jgi:hypothetical protein
MTNTATKIPGRALQRAGGEAKAPVRRLADWLGLAAAPTFATMALITAFCGDSAMSVICAPGQDASLITGMAPMYVLMSVFHAAPWLRLIDSP